MNGPCLDTACLANIKSSPSVWLYRIGKADGPFSHGKHYRVFMMYEDQKKTNGYGRMAPISVHDEAYQGVLDTVDEIHTRQAALKIQIYDRSLTQIKKLLH